MSLASQKFGMTDRQPLLSQTSAPVSRPTQGYNASNQASSRDADRNEDSRLLSRMDESYLYQSGGKFSIRQVGKHRSLYMADFFHSLVNISTWKLLVLVFFMYFGLFIIYTIPYSIVGTSCGAEWTTWLDTFFFSVETSMTIGYGVPDPYFNNCASMAILISTETVFGTILDAVCIGIVYDRLSRAEARAHTVLFSRYAVVRRIDGVLTFQFRVVEMRKHQMTETHVRLIAVRHRLAGAGRPVDYFSQHPLRVHNPDDELGGNLFLAIPQVVTHCMVPEPTDRTNPRSPLLPPASYLRAWEELKLIAEEQGEGRMGPTCRRSKIPAEELRGLRPDSSARLLRELQYRHGGHWATTQKKPGRWAGGDWWRSNGPANGMELTQGAVDSTAGEGHKSRSRGSASDARVSDAGSSVLDNISPPRQNSMTFLEPTTVAAGVAQKPQATAGAGAQERQPRSGSDFGGGGSFLGNPISSPMGLNDSQEQIRRYWEESELEVLVIMEGIDGITSDTCQARHSYRIEDVMFDMELAPCVNRTESGHCEVDFERFNDIMPDSGDTGDSDLYVVFP